jgi:hypothetical protein
MNFQEWFKYRTKQWHEQFALYLNQRKECSSIESNLKKWRQFFMRIDERYYKQLGQTRTGGGVWPAGSPLPPLFLEAERTG